MDRAVCEPGNQGNHFFAADPFFDSPFNGLFFSPEAHVTGPRINITEQAEGFTLEAEVPGWRESDIDLEVSNGVLVLRGKMETTAGEKHETPDSAYQIREFSRRNFERSFRLGEQIDTGNISAKLDSGILTVNLRKKEEVKPRRVKIALGD